MCVRAKSLHWCLALYDPMNLNPPGSSAHGILQAKILEWIAMPSPGDFPNSGIYMVLSKIEELPICEYPVGKSFIDSLKSTLNIGTRNSESILTPLRIHSVSYTSELSVSIFDH